MLLFRALSGQVDNPQSILVDPLGCRNASQILNDVARIISWLLIQCGATHDRDLVGKTIAYIGLNSRWHIDLLLASEQLGAVFMPVNYRLAAPEIRAQLSDAQAVLLISDAAMADLARRVRMSAERESYAATLEPADLSVFARAKLASTALAATAFAPTALASKKLAQEQVDMPCLLVYTSGSGGKAKGVLHSPKTLMANAQAAWEAHDMRTSDRILSALPLFHVGGLCIQTLPALLLGAQVRLLARFDASAWLTAVATDQVTLSLLVPPVMKALREHADFETANLSSLRLLMTGSSIVPEDLITAFHRRGLLVGQVYGATETGPVSIVLKADKALGKVGFAGWPASGVAITLLNETNATGEIALQAPNLMCGYLHEPRRDPNCWFATGDLAVKSSDGSYRIVGRCKELIVSGGENIHPAEIENRLLLIAGIAEVAVVGQPDEQWGEVAVAFLVPEIGTGTNANTNPNTNANTNPNTISDDALREELAKHLARFKIPRRFIWMNSLPKSALGKVQKSELQSVIAKKLGS